MADLLGLQLFVLAITDEEAFCLGSVQSSYRGICFPHNFICINFLESVRDGNSLRCWLEREEQIVLTFHQSARFICSYGKLGLSSETFQAPCLQENFHFGDFDALCVAGVPSSASFSRRT